jgi:succinate-semialdehyde dehydrogenase / glutarate-semialdehyde dehydrogenase
VPYDEPMSAVAPSWVPQSPAFAALTARVACSPGVSSVAITRPATGGPLADLPLSGPDDVVTAVQRARAVQPAWAARSVHDRAQVLLRVHDLVLRRQDEVLDLLQLETGKSRLHAFDEVADVAINARWYADHGVDLLADRPLRGLAPVVSTVREVHHPLGVVGVIVPWNHPFTLAVSDALPALLVGNAVVLKPDPKTSLTALWGAALLAEAGLPADLLHVVTGDGAIGSAVVDQVDYVCFTGSTPTGRIVAARAAARLVGSALELGGKNALYVAQDADLDRAADAAVRDCFTSAGQLCVSMERLLLHRDIAEAFVERLVSRVKALRLGAGLDYDTDLGCLISPEHLDRVAAHVTDAVGLGARVLVGGRARPDLGPTFYEPTVLDRVPREAACYAAETFGPVVSVYRVDGDEQAVATANEGEFGLNAGIWTRDRARGARLARQFRTGTATVNEAYTAVWGSVAAPMGVGAAQGWDDDTGPRACCASPTASRWWCTAGSATARCSTAVAPPSPG